MTVLGGEAVLAWRGWQTGIALRKCFTGRFLRGISCVRMGGAEGSISCFCRWMNCFRWWSIVLALPLTNFSPLSLVIGRLARIPSLPCSAPSFNHHALPTFVPSLTPLPVDRSKKSPCAVPCWSNGNPWNDAVLDPYKYNKYYAGAYARGRTNLYPPLIRYLFFTLHLMLHLYLVIALTPPKS